MPRYEGSYPYFDQGLKPGILSTFLRQGDEYWQSAFLFDKTVNPPRGLEKGIPGLSPTEQQAYQNAVTRGFVPDKPTILTTAS
jgi:hypothetical protein